MPAGTTAQRARLSDVMPTWLMVSTGALKSSFGFAGDAISPQQESLTEAEERGMDDAAEEPSAQ